jgi:hypothetical protein
LGIWTIQRFAAIVALQHRRRQARAATPVEPEPRATVPQVVRWWELLRAGFEPLALQDYLDDPVWNIAGRPWRVLRKGSLVIPVWRWRRPKPDLFPQHRVRMAAYGRLVELSMAARGCAPYGVILYGATDEGTTVPFRGADEEAVFQALRRAREVLAASERGGAPPEPGAPELCRGCHHGRPRPYRPGRSNHVSQGRSLPVVPAVDERERVYHSHCGDKFRWLPPHEVTVARRLRAKA